MSSLERDYHEKRSFIRMKVDTPAEVQVATGDNTLTGICRDLSGGGMSIELDTALPIGSEVVVEIASEHGHAPILKAKSRVSRVISQPSSETEPCTLGLEIVEVLP